MVLSQTDGNKLPGISQFLLSLKQVSQSQATWTLESCPGHLAFDRKTFPGKYLNVKVKKFNDTRVSITSLTHAF